MLVVKQELLEEIDALIEGYKQNIVNAHASIKPWEFGYLRGKHDLLVNILQIVEDGLVTTQDDLLRVFNDQIEEANHKLLTIPINTEPCELGYIKGSRQALLGLYAFLRAFNLSD